ncbi:MAG: phosphotransferase family protein [Acidobacteriota bacterium]|nr:phosphotransferase family protein [Acidobacteriota bacterium]MDH3528173.1 phosphotransferase family protein [Acidobacteriota bacterium]
MPETNKTRKGEELDLGSLRDYLQTALGREIDSLEVLQFPAGSSNLTYSVSFDNDDYVLRRPPFGNQVKTAHDMSREFRVLSRLSHVYRPAPVPLLFCDDESVIGSEFFLMERRRGVIVRGEWPFKFDRARESALTFMQNLADLHSIDYEAAGLADLGRPEGYARRQVEGWSKRYLKSKTDDWPEIENAIKWLNEEIPTTETDTALVHNDYKFDNIVLDPADPTNIVGVLDWEMATIGSPLMDLGTTLGYWMSAEAGEEMMSMPFNPRVLMEQISREELVSMYAEASGRDVSNVAYYYVFGTFKIAVIAQQIYYRYAMGFTSDERFAHFNQFVGTLGRIASRAIERND